MLLPWPWWSYWQTKCPRGRIEADALEHAVWTHVVDLLRDPAQILAQFERLASGGIDHRQDGLGDQLRARIERVNRADRRLLEAYQAAVEAWPAEPPRGRPPAKAVQGG